MTDETISVEELRRMLQLGKPVTVLDVRPAAGITADLFGLRWAIVIVALLTLASGVVVATVMGETVSTNNNGVL